MSLYAIFHAVKNGSPDEKLAFWKLCKTAASAHIGGVGAGLTKIAYDFWAEAYERGEAPAVNQSSREAFAGSFGSACAAENTLWKIAEAGHIDEHELYKMSTWVAESAVNDLAEMTKNANTGVMATLKKPQVLGAILGAAFGAGVGASQHKDEPGKGALVGAIPGAIAGWAMGRNPASLGDQAAMGLSAAFIGTLGKTLFESPVAKTKENAGNRFFKKKADVLPGLEAGGQPPMNADAPSPEMIEQPAPADPQAEGLSRANKTVDNLMFLANQVNLPQLAQEVDQMRDQLAEHFASGHNYLPAELQHHFAQSEHADTFMKKYKQRFGPLASGGSKKTAHDWFSWRTQR